MNRGLFAWGGTSADKFLTGHNGWPRAARPMRPRLRMIAYQRSGLAGAVAFTPRSLAQEGSLLLAWISWSNFNQIGGRQVTPPAGWVELVNLTTGNANFGLWVRVAEDAEVEPTSYTFTISGTGENASGVYVEMVGADVNGLGYDVVSGLTSATLSMLVAREKAVAFAAWKYETAVAHTAPTGWSLVRNTGGSNHQTIVDMLMEPRQGDLLTVTTTGTPDVYIGTLVYPRLPNLAQYPAY